MPPIRSLVVLVAAMSIAEPALAQGAPAAARKQEAPRPPGSKGTLLPAPGGAWALGIDLTGYDIAHHSSSGAAVASLLAHDPGRKVAVAIFIRGARGEMTPEAARDAMWPRQRAAASVRPETVRQVSRPGMALVHFAAAVGTERPAERAHVVAYLAHEGAWAEVDIVQDEPGPEDASEVERLLSSVRVLAAIPPKKP